MKYITLYSCMCVYVCDQNTKERVATKLYVFELFGHCLSYIFLNCLEIVLVIL